MTSKSLLGTLADGTPIHAVTLRSPAGVEAQIVEWGASLRDLVVPLADGTRQRVVLGLREIADYPVHAPHMGAIAGRYANRIGAGRFTLDGRAYRLPLNQDGRHSLRGRQALLREVREHPVAFGREDDALDRADLGARGQAQTQRLGLPFG